jgi:CHAT domain-containing protein
LAEDTEIDSLMRSIDAPTTATATHQLITIAELRDRVLAPGDAVFEYALGEKRSFLWVVTRAAVRLSVLPGRPQIERTTSTLLALLSDIHGRQADPRKQARFQALAGELARMLGFEAWRPGEATRIIIVPDGLLHRLPFSILPIREQTKTRSTALGLVAEVTQLASASVYRVLAERQDIMARQVDATVAAFGDPVYTTADSRLLGGPRRPAAPERRMIIKSEFARLPFSQDELNAVERLVPQARRHIMRGIDATRTAFIQTRLEGYSLLLVSTHAFADDHQPELSSLAFSLLDRRRHPVDGFLRLYDVYESRISPAFVILSACETAAGRAVRGEGLIGLSRGFLYAGASGLLSSLFRVDDEASSAFISDVLEQMLGRERRSPSAAVFHARRLLASSTRWNDPFYWGAFVVMAAGR